MGNDGNITMLNQIYDSTLNTLNISKTDGSQVDFFGMNSIHWGNSALDMNLCEPKT
jgi:hypothetical protein